MMFRCATCFESGKAKDHVHVVQGWFDGIMWLVTFCGGADPLNQVIVKENAGPESLRLRVLGNTAAQRYSIAGSATVLSRTAFLV